MSQPHINNMMLAGCIVCLACIYLEGLDGRYVSDNGYPALCQVIRLHVYFKIRLTIFNSQCWDEWQ